MPEKEYLEREALLSAAKGYDWIAGLKTVMKRIPAADVRPVVRGKWEYVSFMTIRCSNCKEIFNELGGENFCPNCGAKMEES